MLPSTRSLSLEMIEKERRLYDTMVSRRQGMSRRVCDSVEGIINTVWQLDY